jgi:hypothetical protein
MSEKWRMIPKFVPFINWRSKSPAYLPVSIDEIHNLDGYRVVYQMPFIADERKESTFLQRDGYYDPLATLKFMLYSSFVPAWSWLCELCRRAKAIWCWHHRLRVEQACRRVPPHSVGGAERDLFFVVLDR